MMFIGYQNTRQVMKSKSFHGEKGRSLFFVRGSMLTKMIYLLFCITKM